MFPPRPCYILVGSRESALNSGHETVYARRHSRKWSWEVRGVLSADRFQHKSDAIKTLRYLAKRPSFGRYPRVFDFRVILIQFCSVGGDRVWTPPTQTKVWPNPDALALLATLEPGAAP